MHAHHEDHVEMLGERQHAIGVGLGIDPDRCARAQIMNPAAAPTKNAAPSVLRAR